MTEAYFPKLLGATTGLRCNLPLIIGVTGHRDLRSQDFGALEGNVREVFHRLKVDYLGKDNDTPVVVMSSLAEGADQLVARVAIEFGAALVVPLPMTAAEYSRDFVSAPGKASEFERLLALAVSAPEMPLIDGNTFENIQSDMARRALQYREAGVFIVRHCHILLALWNEEDRELKTGGTAEIVHLKRNGESLRHSHLVRDCIDGIEKGPVITIVTPRRDAPSATVGVSTRPWGRELTTSVPQPDFNGETKAWRDFEMTVNLTTRFNRDAKEALSDPVRKEKYKESLEKLFDAPSAPETTTRARALGLREAPVLCSIYAVADVLAQENQHDFRRVWIWLFILGFLMAASLGFPLNFPEVKVYAFAAYQALFTCSFSLYFFARRRQYQEKFLDYRALSETARVAVFWRIAKIDKAVIEVYPICQSPELAWIKVSLRSIACFDDAKLKRAEPFDEARYRVCHGVWINGQFEYFKNHGERHREKAARSKWLSISFLLISGVGTVLIGLSGYLAFDWKIYAPLNSAAYIPLALQLLPVAGAAIQGYAEQLGRRAQALQFERMQALFGRALLILPPSINPVDEAAAREVLIELGREAVQDAASWTSIFRLRPLRPL